MKNGLLWACCALITTVLNAQKIQVQAISPNPYFIKSEDIFNLQITNPSSNAINVTIKGIWFYEGKNAVELLTENIVLQPGINTLNPQNTTVKSKSYLLKVVDDFETSTGNFPAGHYRACIYLSCVTADCNGAGNGIVTSETDPCYEFTAEQPSPLLLSSQPNGNESNNHRPVFTWIPPMPLGGNLDLTYTMTLVQKNSKKQSCTDAILRNRPLLQQDNISSNILAYPADIDQLDTGEYAWQVTAMYEGFSVATSEAWCFTVKEEVKKIDSNVYVTLKTTDNDIHHCKNKLYLSYEELYNGETLNFKLYNQKGIEIPLKEKLKSTYGESRFIIDLNELGLKQNQVYSLCLKNQIGKNYKLRFQLINN